MKKTPNIDALTKLFSSEKSDNTFWCGRTGLGHVPRPPNFCFESKLSSEGSFPKCLRHFSPSHIWFGSNLFTEAN